MLFDFLFLKFYLNYLTNQVTYWLKSLDFSNILRYHTNVRIQEECYKTNLKGGVSGGRETAFILGKRAVHAAQLVGVG